MGVSESGIAGNREFPATSWSVILNAQDPASPDYARHLGRLIELYWRPVYCVIRSRWARGHQDAKDLTQEFFASVVLDRDLLRAYAPQRGSFRALLRTAIGNFMQDVARGSGRQKRGGGAAVLSLEGLAADQGFEPAEGEDALTADEIFDRAWNRSVLAEAVAALESRLVGEGKRAVFEVFRRYDLEGDSAEMSYADLGRALSLTEAQVRKALHVARAALREIVAGIVRGYVDSADDLEAELQSLFGA